MYPVLTFLVLSAVRASEYTETINVQDYLSSLASKNLPKLPNLDKAPYSNVYAPELIPVPHSTGSTVPLDRTELQIQPADSVPLRKHETVYVQIQPELVAVPSSGRGNLGKSVPLGKNDGLEFQSIRNAVPKSGNLNLFVPLSKTEELPNMSHLTVPRPEAPPYPNLNKIQDKPIPLLPKDILKIPPPPLVKDLGYVPPATVKPLPSYVDYAKWDLFKKPDVKDIADHPKSTKFPKLSDFVNLPTDFPKFFLPDFSKLPLPDLSQLPFKLPDLSKFLPPLPDVSGTKLQPLPPLRTDYPRLQLPTLPNFSQLPDLSKFLPPLPDVPVTKLQPLPPLRDDYPKLQLPALPDLSKFPQLPLPDLSVFASEKSEKIIREKRSYDVKDLHSEKKPRGFDMSLGMDLLVKALKVPNLSTWAIPDISKLKDLQIAKIPDIDLAEFILSQGYPVEVHDIVTEDGYILGTYRIPHGRQSSSNQPNPYPIMVNHGIMGSAENFIIGGPERALPFVLADHGFDVWLMNARGSWHSRKHKYLNPDKNPEFWKFTFHEIGYYDLPATIDYIIDLTGQPRLHYIGHSQGTTVFFVMASERPEYNAKIKLNIALAPSVILTNIPDPTAQWGAPLYPQLLKMVESTKFYETNPPQIVTNQAIRSILRSICGEKGDPNICLNMFKTMSYGIGDQIDPKTIPLIAATVLGGASAYQSVHFAQVVATGKFSQMDWGEKENLKRYHQKHPPQYNLNNVVCPVSLMYAQSDSLIAVKDVMALAHLLPNVVDLYKVPYENWTHMDFVWAKSVDKYLNPHLLELLYKYLE